MTALVDFPDQDREAFVAQMHQLGYHVEVQEPMDDIPQWQIEETLRRDAINKPEDYVKWSDVKGKYARRNI